MESLHRNKGGAKSKRAEPSEKEGMGLAVGAAMLWCKLRDSTSGAFFTKIAEEVKRCMDGDRTFSKEDMVHFVQNKLFGASWRGSSASKSKYSLWPAQKLLWAETIKYFPKLEAGLTKAQAAKPPMPDFDFGMPSTSTAPEPDFS